MEEQSKSPDLHAIAQGTLLGYWRRQMEAKLMNKIPEHILQTFTKQHGLEYEIDLTADMLILTHPGLAWCLFRIDVWRIDDKWWFSIYARSFEKHEFDYVRAAMECATQITDWMNENYER